MTREKSSRASKRSSYEASSSTTTTTTTQVVEKAAAASGPATKRSKRNPSVETSSTSTKAAADASKKQEVSKKAPAPPTKARDFKSCQEVITYVDQQALWELPDRPPKLAPLSASEKHELEKALGIYNNGQQSGGCWREDWMGNLAFADEDIVNPKGTKRESFKQSLFEWAEVNAACRKILHSLFRHVSQMRDVPLRAKQILASAPADKVEELEAAVRRVSYDPLVLEQDGWTTTKAAEPVGASGGPHRIGELVRWQSYDAAVIAYTHDDEIGDLWKAFWLEANEGLATFDMEAEELENARKNWNRRYNPKSATTTQASTNTTQSAAAIQERKSARAAQSANFRVNGISEGIVLAQSMSPGARSNVFWPARVLHASEWEGSSSQGKRAHAKISVNIVFMAPFWEANGNSNRGRRPNVLSETDQKEIDAASLFQVESVEAGPDTIREYPYNPEDGMDLWKLRQAFKIFGLPKGVFKRFLNGHRLAQALKLFARRNITVAPDRINSTGLFDSHPLSVLAPKFPEEVLHLPYGIILDSLPTVSRTESVGDATSENVLQLRQMVDALQPPQCWTIADDREGEDHHESSVPQSSSKKDGLNGTITPASSPPHNPKRQLPTNIAALVRSLPHLKSFLPRYMESPGIANCSFALSKLLETYVTAESKESSTNRREIFCTWTAIKTQGEVAIALLESAKRSEDTLTEWRRLCEMVYRSLQSEFAAPCHCLVIADGSSNMHHTTHFSFERVVRIPAALKGVKLALESAPQAIQQVFSVEKRYIDYVENSLLKKAHDTSYLARMESRCRLQAGTDKVVMLTEDSEGNGGEDTSGCVNTWIAAVTAVAAAVAAVDEVVFGSHVNAFCVTRPPGHHAGRKLHAMKAVSNGFCLLNQAACAAIHAVSPICEGGLGLRRVCVLDFDVHHGNGTQDILCSTYDPRFLYVSIHAGGEEVNGTAADQPDGDRTDLPLKNKKNGGIYPGRCGDTSPHEGVLNLPLGVKVTSHAVGTALLDKATPVIEKFCPDLIILSSGFDAHRNDPMGLGNLTAENYGHITEIACQLASKSCSGRIVSILEGGYGVPCCRPQRLPPDDDAEVRKGGTYTAGNEDPQITSTSPSAEEDSKIPSRSQPSRLADLEGFLKDDMEDQMTLALQKKLEKCHEEGFIDCVREHVEALARCRVAQDSKLNHPNPPSSNEN